MTTAPRDAFDFAAYKRAVVMRDIPAWTANFADDAEWVEYKNDHPPRSPRRMQGTQAIAESLAMVGTSDVALAIEDEVVGPSRAAYCLWCTFPDGKRIIEHVIVHFSHGKITRQVDVESWD